MVSSGMKSGLLLGFGAFFVCSGAVLMVYWPIIFFNQLKGMLALSEESMSFDIWRETPIPMYLEVFMFNFTNTDEILSDRTGTVKPRLEQLGPYVFRESHLKVNLTWNDNSTVTFYNNRTWHFAPEKSNGSLDDMITSINVILVTVSATMRHEPFYLRPVVNLFLRSMHEHMFVTRNVTDWMFDGIEDPVIDWALANDIPFNIPYDRFGWFYNRNNSETFDGQFIMNTGVADISRLGNIEKWNGVSRTEFFREECADIKGSTGELFPPELDQDEILIFASDLCTYITLHHDEPITVEGITGVRYVANSSVFDNGYNYPQMACYCDEVRDDTCMLAGVLNMTNCRFGAPAFVSFPHFYNADPHYLTMVDGMNPSREEHEFRMGLELFTGIPLDVRAQLQINILVRHVAGMSIANSLPDDTLLPMFWFRQEVELTPEFASQARLALNLRYGIMYALYVSTAIGVILLMFGIAVLTRRLLRSPMTTPLVSTEDITQ